MAGFAPRRILVAFDLSRDSRAGWRYAQALASRLHAEVEAVYVAPWTPVAVSPALGPASLPSPALTRESLDSIARLVRERIGPDAVVRIAEGEPVREILEAAEESGAGLIVTTTRGLTGLKRVVGGSVTEGVVRASTVPVLSLRGEARPAGSILAPVNAESYSLEGLRFARSLGRALGARVTALHVIEKRPRRANAPLRVQLLEEAVRAMADVELRMTDGDPVTTILKEAAHHDLVVLVSHRKGILRDALLGTTAEQVLRRSPVPVLSVPVRVRSKPPARRQERGVRRAGRERYEIEGGHYAGRGHSRGGGRRAHSRGA